MAGIFNIDWRKFFGQAQPPAKRFPQTLDLGESLLTTLKTDSDALNVIDDTLQLEKKYSGIRMVMIDSLNEKFMQSTFDVVTTQDIARVRWWFTEIEAEAIYLNAEEYQRPHYLFNFSEPAADVSITVHVPQVIYDNRLAEVDTEVKKLKVAGKSYKLVTL